MGWGKTRIGKGVKPSSERETETIKQGRGKAGKLNACSFFDV